MARSPRREEPAIDARPAALLLAATLALAGCATPAPPPATPPGALPAAPDSPAGTPEWWTVHVRMGWRGAEHVQWHLDALLAEQVFAPVIRRYGPALVLWRFHRRAAPDDLGHQVRFLYYADPAVAAQVTAAVGASAVLDRLRAGGHVSQVLLPVASDGAAVEATSDQGWPESIQRAWPHFAMGVSANWLALIGEESARLGPPPAGDVSALVEHYRAVNGAVDRLWQDHALHAWLHHLNALYGYRALWLQERRLIRF